MCVSVPIRASFPSFLPCVGDSSSMTVGVALSPCLFDVTRPLVVQRGLTALCVPVLGWTSVQMARLAVPALKVEHWAKLPLYRLKNTLITQQHSALLLLLEDATRMCVCACVCVHGFLLLALWHYSLSLGRQLLTVIMTSRELQPDTLHLFNNKHIL